MDVTELVSRMPARVKILEYLEEAPASTSEMAFELNLPVQHVRNTCRELEDLGAIHRLGVVRNGQRGHPPILWSI